MKQGEEQRVIVEDPTKANDRSQYGCWWFGEN